MGYLEAKVLQAMIDGRDPLPEMSRLSNYVIQDLFLNTFGTENISMEKFKKFAFDRNTRSGRFRSGRPFMMNHDTDPPKKRYKYGPHYLAEVPYIFNQCTTEENPGNLKKPGVKWVPQLFPRAIATLMENIADPSTDHDLPTDEWGKLYIAYDYLRGQAAAAAIKNAGSNQKLFKLVAWGLSKGQPIFPEPSGPTADDPCTVLPFEAVLVVMAAAAKKLGNRELAPSIKENIGVLLTAKNNGASDLRETKQAFEPHVPYPDLSVCHNSTDQWCWAEATSVDATKELIDHYQHMIDAQHFIQALGASDFVDSQNFEAITISTLRPFLKQLYKIYDMEYNSSDALAIFRASDTGVGTPVGDENVIDALKSIPEGALSGDFNVNLTGIEGATKKEIKNFKKIDQCILLSLMPSLKYVSIARRYWQLGHEQYGGMPYGGKIIPLQTHAPENLINYLTMGYIDDEITGQKLSAYEVIQNLSSKEAGLIKFIPKLYKNVKSGRADVALELPIFGAANMIDEKTGKSLPFSTGARLDDVKISFKGSTPATAKNNVEVSLTFKCDKLSEFMQMKLIDRSLNGPNRRASKFFASHDGRRGSNNEPIIDEVDGKLYFGDRYEYEERYEFAIVDLIMAPLLARNAEGYGRVFKSQYHPDYGRISLKLQPLIAQMFTTINEGTGTPQQIKARQRQKKRLLENFFNSNALVLDLTPIDHTFKKSAETTDASLTITYRGYCEGLLTSGMFDALVNNDVIKSRMVREVALEKAVEEDCSPGKVAELQQVMMADQVLENGKAMQHIFNFLLTGNSDIAYTAERKNVYKIENQICGIYALNIPYATIRSAVGKKAYSSDVKIMNPEKLWEYWLEITGNPRKPKFGSGFIGASESTSAKIMTDGLYVVTHFEGGQQNVGLEVKNDGKDVRDTQRINFFFFGDLIDAVTQSITDKPIIENWIRKKDRFNFPTLIDRGSDKASDKKFSTKFGKMIKILTGPIEYFSSSTGKMETVNLVDIPISFALFQEWMQENVIEQELFRMPVVVFLRSVLKGLIAPALNESCFSVGNNDFVLDVLYEKGNYFHISPEYKKDIELRYSRNTWGQGGIKIVSGQRNKVKVNLGVLNGNMAKHDPVSYAWAANYKRVNGQFKSTTIKGRNLAAVGNIKSYPHTYGMAESVGGVDSMHVHGMDMAEGLAIGPGDQFFLKDSQITGPELYDYVLLYGQKRQIFNPKNNGNKETNVKRRVQILKQFSTTSDGSGQKSGPIKSLEFSKTNDKYKRESRYAAKFTNVTQLSSVYDVTMKTSFPMTHLYPGQLIFLVTEDLGEPNDRESLAYKLGFGGYHTITEVTHTFGDFSNQEKKSRPSSQTTTVKAKWLYSGIPSIKREKPVSLNDQVRIQKAKDKWCQELIDQVEDLTMAEIETLGTDSGAMRDFLGDISDWQDSKK